MLSDLVDNFLLLGHGQRVERLSRRPTLAVMQLDRGANVTRAPVVQVLGSPPNTQQRRASALEGHTAARPPIDLLLIAEISGARIALQHH